MASLVTAQFERYIAEQTVSRGSVVFDEFIFANIPGLTEDNLAQHLKMPTNAQIVHRQEVSQNGVINENAVVYSVTMGTEVGDFDFNFIGLINKSQNLLAVAVQTAPVKKTRNKNAVQGNSITRNILLEFSGAKALTGINVNANTWQIDFTVRLHGIDEKIRYTHRDLYGRAVFFGDSFKVERQNAQHYRILPGTAYVEGVRLAEATEKTMDINHLPCSIYVDVVHHCTVTGAYETEIRYITQNKADYLDTANRQHYVQILADIDRQGNVTDRRLLSPLLGMNPLTLDDTTENTKDELGHTHKLPIASVVKKGIVKLFSGYDSDAEDMAATPKAIKGLKALIDALTRNQGNYIPNSKKSSAVDSNSEDTVANSKAVKTAYDKGVEAKAAAENAHSAANNAQHTANEGVSRANSAQSTADAAQRTANNGVSKANEANSNANGRVSKSGDTMTGLLTALGFIANSPTASVMFRSQTALSAFLDFAQKNTQHALTTLESISFADNAAEFRMHLTPQGDNNDTDRREHTFTFQPGGNIWSKKFGWFDQYFGKKPTFTYYQHHYLGASVYKIPFSDTQCLKITLMLADHAWSDELILPEIYNGQFLVNAIDAGGGKDALGVFGVSNNRIKLLGDGGTRAAIFVFGEGPL